MTIYILQAFSDEHKWRTEAVVLGLFTSKTALRKAVKDAQAELGIYNKKEFEKALNLLFDEPFHWAPYSVNDWMETGMIEMVEGNRIYADGII